MPKRAQVAPRPTIPVIGPEIPAKNLSPAQKVVYLQPLLSDPTIAKFKTHFLLIDLDRDAFRACSGLAQGYYGGHPNNDYLYDLYGTAHTANPILLKTKFDNDMTGSPVFAGANTYHQTFIRLEDVQHLVPYEIASLLSGSFFNGLVTRLILTKYASNWTGQLGFPLDLFLPSALLPTGMTAPQSWVAEELNFLIATFGTRTNWDKWSVAPAPYATTKYAACLNQMTPASAQLAGILQGWLLADSLNNGSIPNGAAQINNIFQLLNSRYTTKHLGEMMGYTLSYLSGFLRNERVLSAATATNAAQVLSDISGPTNTPVLYAKYSDHMKAFRHKDNRNDFLLQLPNNFYNLVLGELYALTLKPPVAVPVVASHRDFLHGYLKGTTQASESMYAAIYNAAFEAGFVAGFQEGYSVGYSNGFSDGYSQGYAAGWQVGYGSGYGAGYSDGQATGNKWTSTLQQIGTVLGQADTVLKDAGTVATVIGSIF